MTTRNYAQMTRENRARRAAARQGLHLAKIRRRDPRALGYGRWLLTAADGTLLAGTGETGAALEDVERYLKGQR